MSDPMTEDSLVAAALVRTQGMEPENAMEIVEQLRGEPDILAAAAAWAGSGEFPDTPMVEGLTPAKLAAEFRPSQVFTLLVTLRNDPEGVKAWFAHDRRPPFPRP